MTLNRKAFLRRAAMGAATLATASALPGQGRPAAAAATAAPTLPPFDAQAPERYWTEIRSLYPLTRDLAYFNTGGLGPASSPVLNLVQETTRQLQERSEHGHARFAGARVVAARFLGAEVGEIAFVRNATEANGIIAAGLKLGAGDEVIFESHAHPGGSFPWMNQHALRGVVVKLFEPDGQSAAGNLARIEKLITPRTRVVQVSHVTAPTGIRLPVEAIARLCRERQLWFHVDGAQTAGMFPFSLRDIGCDSYATSGHKWLGAPHETGVLYVRKDRIAEVAPTLVGAYSGDADNLLGDLQLHPTADRFEYGTRNVAAVLGMAEAMRLQEQIGRERIAQRGLALISRVHAGLSGIRGVEVLTSLAPEVASPMLAFRAAAVPFDRMFTQLLRDHALRCRPVSEEKLNAIRVSTHLFNSPAECDRLVAAVEKIVQSA